VEGENFKEEKRARGTRGAAPRVWVGGDLERVSVVALGEGGEIKNAIKDWGWGEHICFLSTQTDRASNPRIHHHSTDSLV